MTELFLFPQAVQREPAIELWLAEQRHQLGPIAQRWFTEMRRAGDDVRELMHDGCPVACAGEAAFGYVNAFKSHVNVGFYFGSQLSDPARLLEGTGKLGRHVKLRPGVPVDEEALRALILAAYADMKARVQRARQS